jgi:hypothetical protein
VIGSRMVHQMTIQLTDEAMFSVSGYAETRIITTEISRQCKSSGCLCSCNALNLYFIRVLRFSGRDV